MTRVVRVADGSGRVLTGLVRDEHIEFHDAEPLTLLEGERQPLGEAVAIADKRTLAVEPPYRLLRPLDPPEVWAAGVTYERSRRARREETEVADVYSLVYRAQRPELFLKDAECRRTVGPNDPIYVRSDSTWTVPEAELALVLGENGRVVGVTAGNDVTARDIEAKNPLYLPQAKIFRGSCAIGPTLAPPKGFTAVGITLEIRRANGDLKFSGSTSTRRLKRSFDELARFACRDNPVPPGSLLLTGTGIVPPDDIALEPGDIVEIDIEGLGALRNPVST